MIFQWHFFIFLLCFLMLSPSHLLVTWETFQEIKWQQKFIIMTGRLSKLSNFHRFFFLFTKSNKIEKIQRKVQGKIQRKSTNMDNLVNNNVVVVVVWWLMLLRFEYFNFDFWCLLMESPKLQIWKKTKKEGKRKNFRISLIERINDSRNQNEERRNSKRLIDKSIN